MIFVMKFRRTPSEGCPMRIIYVLILVFTTSYVVILPKKLSDNFSQ